LIIHIFQGDVGRRQLIGPSGVRALPLAPGITKVATILDILFLLLLPPLFKTTEGNSDSSETSSEMSWEGPQSSLDENRIIQLDGQAGGSSEDEVMLKKKIFSVHCEIKDIAQVITFFRGLSFVWKSLTGHKMCQSSLNCFFCHMRSSCLRLSAQRGYGPKSLKVIEFSSQLDQYQTILGWNWSESVSDIPTFIEHL
jgi:hypothetical protein